MRFEDTPPAQAARGKARRPPQGQQPCPPLRGRGRRLPVRYEPGAAPRRPARPRRGPNRRRRRRLLPSPAAHGRQWRGPRPARARPQGHKGRARPSPPPLPRGRAPRTAASAAGKPCGARPPSFPPSRGGWRPPSVTMTVRDSGCREGSPQSPPQQLSSMGAAILSAVPAGPAKRGAAALAWRRPSAPPGRPGGREEAGGRRSAPEGPLPPPSPGARVAGRRRVGLAGGCHALLLLPAEAARERGRWRGVGEGKGARSRCPGEERPPAPKRHRFTRSGPAVTREVAASHGSHKCGSRPKAGSGRQQFGFKN